MKISLYRSAKDNSPSCHDVSWDKLKTLLLEFEERTDKDGKAWSPVEIAYGETRGNKNVQSISCAVFDLDKLGEGENARPLTPEDIVPMAKALEGIEYVCHSSFQHDPKAGLRLRLILPLEKPFEKENQSTAQYQAAWEHIRSDLVRRYQIPADPSCKDLSRLYFLPTSRPGAERVAESSTGTRIALSEASGVDSGGVSAQPSQQETIQQAGQPTGSVLQSSRQDPKADSGLIDLDAVRKTLSSKPYLKNALAGKAFAKAGERDTVLTKLVGAVAWAIPTLPVEAFLELFAKSLISVSLEAEPGTIESDVGYWIKLATDKYERSQRQYREHKEQEVAQLKELESTFGVGTPTKLAPQTDAWRELLVWKEDADGNTALANTPGNAFLILKYSNEWRGAFRFNLVTRSIEVVKGPIPVDTDPDILPTLVADWFSIHAKPEERLRLRENDVASRILAAALDNAYDPVCDYLNGLKWDGVKRLDSAPFNYFAALREDEDGSNIEKHVQTVWRRWMLGAVARAFEPGCKMDTVLILESIQGQRKSTALSVLGGAWFTDAKFSIGDKDGSMIIGRAWICELAEMDNAKTTEPATHRAFFSRRTDTFRAPYGRSVRDWLRRCVFVGSINPDGSGYLQDLTGNRRYWPIAVGLADTRALSKDRDSLWAEAVAIYREAATCEQCAADEDLRCSEHRWWLNRDEEIIAEQQVEQRVETDDFPSMIEDWWKKTPIAMRPITMGITTSDLALKLNYPVSQISRPVQTKLGHALKKLGWLKRKRSGVRLYMAPKHFLDMPDMSGKVYAEVARA